MRLLSIQLLSMNYFQMGLRQKTNHKYSYRFSMNNFFQCLSVLYYCVLYEDSISYTGHMKFPGNSSTSFSGDSHYTENVFLFLRGQLTLTRTMFHPKVIR